MDKSDSSWLLRIAVFVVVAIRILSIEDDLSKPNHEITDEFAAKCRYYSKEIHEAAFVLPTFAKKALYE